MLPAMHHSLLIRFVRRAPSAQAGLVYDDKYGVPPAADTMMITPALLRAMRRRLRLLAQAMPHKCHAAIGRPTGGHGHDAYRREDSFMT